MTIGAVTASAGMVSHHRKQFGLAESAFFLLLCSYYVLRPVFGMPGGRPERSPVVSPV